MTKKTRRTRNLSRTSPVPKRDNMTLLAEAVANEYKSDPSGAGLVVARITSGEFYVSIARYSERFGQGKSIVCSAKGATVAEAVDRVAAHWLNLRSAKDELRSAIKTNFRIDF